MAIPRSKKEIILGDAEKIASADKPVFFVDAGGLKAADLNALRKAIKAAGGKFQMIKKRLAKMAFAKAAKDAPEIFGRKGSLALASSSDPIATAKTIYQFSKKNNLLKIVGGFLDKSYVSAAQIINLAKLPSREVLLGQLVGVIASPIRRFTMVLDANIRKLLLTFEAIKRSKQ